MDLLEPQDSHARRRWIVASVIVTLVLMLAGVAIVRVALFSAHGSSFIANRLGQLFGMPVRIMETQFDLPELRLRGITLGNDVQGTADVITIRLGLNPFQANFLGPQQVSIGKVTLNLTKQDLATVLTRLGGKSDETAKSGGVVSLHMVPRIATLERLELEMGDSEKSKTLVLNQLKCNSEEGLTCRSVSLNSTEGWREQDFGFALRSGKTGGWIVDGSGRSDWGDDSEGSSWTGQASLTISDGGPGLKFRFSGFPALLEGMMEKYLGDLPTRDLRGSIKIRPATDGSIGFSVASETDSLLFNSTIIGNAPMGPFPAYLRAKGKWHGTTRTLVIDEGAFIFSGKRLPQPPDSDGPNMMPKTQWEGLGTLRVYFSARGEWDQNHGAPGQSRPSMWQTHVTIPETGCQELMQVAPELIWPPLKNLVLKGMAGFDADIAWSSLRPEQFMHTIKSAHFDCRPVRVPTELSGANLRGPVLISRTLADGTSRMINLDPSNENFVSLTQIPAAVKTAIVTAEDSGFWIHKGIDFPQMEIALRRNLSEGKIKVGASTITMQTVKNLFLSNERTLLRKMQELLLSWLIEQQVDKHRVLELYLNAIEFGPGIYGIGEASRHFFDKHPGELNLLEGTYLATLLPAPVERYSSFCKGELTPGHKGLMQTFLNRLQDLGRISPTEYRAYTNSSITFSPRNRADLDACQKRILLARGQNRRGAAKAEH